MGGGVIALSPVSSNASDRFCFVAENCLVTVQRPLRPPCGDPWERAISFGGVVVGIIAPFFMSVGKIWRGQGVLGDADGACGDGGVGSVVGLIDGDSSRRRGRGGRFLVLSPPWDRSASEGFWILLFAVANSLSQYSVLGNRRMTIRWKEGSRSAVQWRRYHRGSDNAFLFYVGLGALEGGGSF